MTYVRTPEHRQALAERNQIHKPWLKSTGPKSEAGKRKSSRNAFKGGMRPMMRELAKALREQAEFTAGISGDLTKGD